MSLATPRLIKNWRDPAAFAMPRSGFVANRAGFGRRFAPHQETDLAEQAFSAFGLHMDAVEPLFGHMVGHHFKDGAFVHEHKDPAPIGYAHTRCNWMVKKPSIGGAPVIDGEVLPVDEGDLWLCLASLERHSSTPISGGERIVFSFGALVCLAQVQPFLAGGQPLHSAQDSLE